MGGSGIGHREHFVDHRAQLPTLDERPGVLGDFLRKQGLELVRARSQRRSGQGVTAGHQHGEVYFGLHPALYGDRHVAAVLGQALDLAGDVAAGHHVQNDVDAGALGEGLGQRRKILRAVVDRVVGAQLQAGLALVVAAGGGNDGGAQGLGHLDGRDTNAAGAALHQQGLAGGELGAVEDVAPDGEEGLGQRSRLDVGQAQRSRQALTHRRHAVLRVAAASDQRADAVAHPKARGGQRLGIASDDLARDFQAGNVRRARGHRVVAGALKHIGAVDAAGRHADQQFARAGHRLFALGQAQHLGGAGLADFYDLHVGAISCRAAPQPGTARAPGGRARPSWTA